jgi:hypothetical protein
MVFFHSYVFTRGYYSSHLLAISVSVENTPCPSVVFWVAGTPCMNFWTERAWNPPQFYMLFAPKNDGKASNTWVCLKIGYIPNEIAI